MMLQQANTKKQSRGKLKAIALSTVFLSGVVYLQSCNGNIPATDKPASAKQDTAAINIDSAMSANQTTLTVVPDNASGEVGHKFTYSGPGSIHGTTKELAPTSVYNQDAGYDLNSFLYKNLHYPEYARMKNIQGRVTVKFIVDEKGHVIMPEIMSSPDTSLSREALAVVKKFPDWKTGSLTNGERSPMAFYLPISFKLEN